MRKSKYEQREKIHKEKGEGKFNHFRAHYKAHLSQGSNLIYT